MQYLNKVLIAGSVSSAILASMPDLSVLWDVLISFAVSFVTILGSKLINYLSKKMDDDIDLKSKFTHDKDDDKSDN